MMRQCILCNNPNSENKFSFEFNDNSILEVFVCDNNHNFDTIEQLALVLKLKLGLTNINKITFSDNIIKDLVI